MKGILILMTVMNDNNVQEEPAIYNPWVLWITKPTCLIRQLQSLTFLYRNGFPWELFHHSHMGGCQNYGPFLDPQYNTAPNI